MKTDTTRFRKTVVVRALLTAFCGSATMMVATDVAAQATATGLQRVEITGSNIRRTDTETSSPVQVINRADIERSGKQTISEIIQELPFNNNGSVPTTFGNGFAAGGSGASLRGLSVNSTLVLVNGRRLAPYGLADDGQRNFADLSSIPLDLVDRVEVLKDGASAIYGSDALAGVINIILRKDFTGLAASASAGTSKYGDANEQRVTLTKGFGNSEKFNAFINFEYSHKDRVTMKDRDGQRGFVGVGDTTPFGYDLLNSGLSMIRGYKLSGASVSSSPTGWARAVTGPNSATAAPGSSYVQMGGGACVPSPTSPITPINANPACLWNVYDYVDIRPAEDKINLFGRASLDLNPNMQAYAEASIFNSKVSTRFTPTSFAGTWVNPSQNAVVSSLNTTMGPNHPDNPNAGSYSRLRYTAADLGGRNSDYDTTVGRILVGLKGTMANWDYDSGLLYTQSKTDIARHGYVRYSVLQSMLDGTNPLGYYRFGVNSGLNSAAVNSALSPDLNNSTKTSVTSLDFKASRELMKMAGGNMGVALGAEYRVEKLDSPPTPFTSNGDIIGLGYSAFNQSRNVFAAFGELVAPVTKTIELSAAARYDRYSDWGSVVTPKIGAKWKVLDPLLLRATYAQGFRAPGAAESGNSSVSAFTSYVDPVRCPGGVPVAGAIRSADCGSGTVSVFSVGNRGIEPEKSKSLNLGLVFEPTRNINIAVDLWQIERKNEIIGADAQAVLNNPAGYPGSAIVRDPGTALPGLANSGTLLAVSAPYLNGPKTLTNGVDVDVRWRAAPFANGVRLSGGVNLSHIKTFRRTMPDGTVLDYAGTYGPTALSSSAGMPRTKTTVDLTASQGPWSVTGRVNYVSGIHVVESKQDTTCLGHNSAGEDFTPGCRVPSFTTMDMFASYKVNKSWEINGSIRNLFDKLPPFDPQASYGLTHYNPSYAHSGAIGRYFNIGVKYRFE